MENNLILEGLLSMVTELKEKQEAQVTPASREETGRRFDAIEQRISELRSNPSIPENELQAISNQLAVIRKGEQEQRQSLEYIKKYVTASYGCLKSLLDTLVYSTRKDEETKHIPWYDKILNRITSYLKPKFFLLSAGIALCFVSLTLNIRFAERMQELQDNDIKYRYLLMKGKADGNDINLLEINFNWERDNAFIQSLIDSVIDFEYRSRKQAEALERARLLDEQAKQLKEQADKLGKP
ncbi:hypothetical protein [Phocaeicola sp.]